MEVLLVIKFARDIFGDFLESDDFEDFTEPVLDDDLDKFCFELCKGATLDLRDLRSKLDWLRSLSLVSLMDAIGFFEVPGLLF